jgi:hypothetical protein
MHETITSPRNEKERKIGKERERRTTYKQPTALKHGCPKFQQTIMIYFSYRSHN